MGVKDWTPRKILDQGLCTNSCLNATGRERTTCECPRCLGLLHGLGADQPIRGSGVRVAVLLAALSSRGGTAPATSGGDPDEWALIPIAAVKPSAVDPDDKEVASDAAG